MRSTITSQEFAAEMSMDGQPDVATALALGSERGRAAC